MKAIRVSEYGGPSVLKLEEIPAPQPGPGQVLVRNHAAGVNPVDTYLRSNTDNRGPKLPYTPGSDAAGVIEAVGAGVTRSSPAIACTSADRSAARTPRCRCAPRRRCTRCRATSASRRGRR